MAGINWIKQAFTAQKLGPEREKILLTEMMKVAPACKQRRNYRKKPLLPTRKMADNLRERILRALADAPRTYAELATLSDTPYHSVAGYIARMSGWGYVVKRRDPSKKMRTVVRITPAGEQYLRDL